MFTRSPAFRFGLALGALSTLAFGLGVFGVGALFALGVRAVTGGG